jgi:hypothetical protein
MTAAERTRTQRATYRDVQAQLIATAHLSDAQRIAHLSQYLATVLRRLAADNG